MDAELARRRGVEVGHSLNMIAELPAYVGNRQVPAALRAAALDAFFVHVRLLIEFLTAPKNDRAIGWRDYTSGFHLKVALRRPLNAAADIANHQVAHLNASRVKAATSPAGERMTAAGLRPHAEAVFAVLEAFVSHLAENGSEYAGDFDGWLREARRRAAAVAVTR